MNTVNTVLLVEDSLTESRAITDYLQQSGLKVVSVGSVEEAQEKLSRQKPDLIVLGVIVPGQSGFELCHELKSDPETNWIPVVMCSTKSAATDKLWGRMMGADAYLAKPISRQQLIQTIQRLIQPTVNQLIKD